MEIEYAFMADAAEAPPGGKLYVLGAGFDEIQATAFPATHPVLALVVKVRLHPAECETEHTVAAELWDADGQRLGPRIEQRFRPSRSARRPTAAVYQQLVANLVGIQFPAPGDYTFEILLDGTHAKTLPLRLELRAAPGQASA